MRIVLIIGSVREGRQTDKIGKYLAKKFEQYEDVTCEILDLANLDIPILTARWEKQEDPPQILPHISNKLKHADAVVLCSPEYHGSYSGVIKNAIDHYWKEFQRKPMGVVATGSGRFGGINASTEMQLLILSLGAFPMPYKLLVPYIQKIFDEDGEPNEEFLVKNTQRFVEEFLWFASALIQAKEREELVSSS